MRGGLSRIGLKASFRQAVSLCLRASAAVLVSISVGVPFPSGCFVSSHALRFGNALAHRCEFVRRGG